MDSAEISNKLQIFLEKEIVKRPGRKIDADEALLSSGLIDSFHLVDLALFVEDNFNVHIDDAELSASTFDSLNGLTNLILSRL